MIEIEHLTKRFGSDIAVDDVSLTIARGELLVLLGGSGSGKTTTLRMVNRLIEPSSGVIRIEGENTRGLPGHELRRRIGYCIQQVGLFPHMTVAGNAGLVPSLLGWSPARIAVRVDELLEMVELPPAAFRERYPHELSGGQQQRVGVARALAAKPSVVLFDEPFGSLDPITRDRIQQSFQKIRGHLGLTGIFVTHDMVEALLLGDRIAVLEEGRLVQVGTPREMLNHPANETVRGLMSTPRRQAAAVDALLEGRQ